MNDLWTSIAATDRSVDAMLDLLANARRRRLLRCLDRFDEPVALPDLADELAVAEYESRIDDIPAEAVKRIYMTLYHHHLPKLADHGIVVYDQGRDIVAPTDRADVLWPILDQVDGGEYR